MLELLFYRTPLPLEKMRLRLISESINHRVSSIPKDFHLFCYEAWTSQAQQAAIPHDHQSHSPRSHQLP
jgi:hypothetical protein